MKINIWLNDYYNRYNLLPKDTYSHIDVDLFSSIIDDTNENDLIILRGEPTIHPFLWQLLNKLQDRNFILTTECAQTNNLLNYKKSIPYLSFRWDGFLNDQIRGKRPLTINMKKLLAEFSGHETQLRVEYTISPYNLEYLDVDMLILQKMMLEYSKMKQPFLVVYQQSQIYNQEGYVWTPLSRDKIKDLNSKGILTQKTMKMLDGWLKKTDYSCIAPQSELTIDNQGRVRICQSLRFGDIIGDLKNNSLQDIITNTEEIRSDTAECPLKNQCWLAYHYKDNINGQT